MTEYQSSSKRLVNWFYESLSQCRQCRQEIQQTELSFLRPPSQRTKCRYFNLDSLINWGHKILLYEESQDFSLMVFSSSIQHRHH